jgi:hypothetical protein
MVLQRWADKPNRYTHANATLNVSVIPTQMILFIELLYLHERWAAVCVALPWVAGVVGIA